MTLARYKEIKKMSTAQIMDFIHVVTDLKANFNNRLYATFFINAAEFNYGSYSMCTGYNCERATRFFLNDGLNNAKKKLAGNTAEMEEIKEIEKFLGFLVEGNKKLCMPWRSYSRVRWYSPSFPNITFLDSPLDGIFWKDIKKVKLYARMTDKAKRKSLSDNEREKVIQRLLKRTDVTCYEKQALDFVSYSELSAGDKKLFNKYRDLLAAFNADKGGGSRTCYAAG